MYKNLLVPLDGSNLAEAALPAAASIARAFNSTVTLLHIIEKDAPEEIHKEHHLTNAKEAKAYLEETAGRAFPQKTRIRTHVHTAAVADVVNSIVHHAHKELQPDLIILCSHGRSGMHNLVSGSIAQQVVAQSTIPVLLVKPRRESFNQFNLRRILVPLDNESIHDASLPPTLELAKAFHAELDLICVVPTLGTLPGEKAATGSMLPSATAAYLNMEEERAQKHLQDHLDDLQKKSIQASAEIARGDPAVEITRQAETTLADLIVFGTHGNAGMEAFWRRSVTASVILRTETPTLLIPIQE